jgi:molybdenum-dependent DNA-binding transcriptional regulator ModE
VTFEQIGYFLALAEEGSFIRAAPRCGISQPSMTNAIKSLEAALGGSLFVRTGIGSALTAFGRQMYPVLERLHRDRQQVLELARHPEHFQEKWIPVFRPKTRQTQEAGAHSDSIKTECALGQSQFKFNGKVLTARLVAVLLEHAGGPRPLHAQVMELRALRSLAASGLIRFNRANRPTHSMATARGREVIGAFLASQVDAPADGTVQSFR